MGKVRSPKSSKRRSLRKTRSLRGGGDFLSAKQAINKFKYAVANAADDSVVGEGFGWLQKYAKTQRSQHKFKSVQNMQKDFNEYVMSQASNNMKDGRAWVHGFLNKYHKGHKYDIKS